MRSKVYSNFHSVAFGYFFKDFSSKISSKTFGQLFLNCHGVQSLLRNDPRNRCYASSYFFVSHY